MTRKQWVLYDERANYDEDEATVLSSADSLEEARRDKRELFPSAVIFEYVVKNGVAAKGRRVS